MGEKIIRISQELFKDNELEKEKIYLLKLLDVKPSENCINRIFGPPIGIDDDNWPRFEGMDGLELQEWDGDTRMDHVFTIDLEGVDILKPKDARALAFFLSDSKYHNAWELFNDEAKVLYLTKDDIKKGLYTGSLPKKQPKSVESFEIIPVEVPKEVFFVDEIDEKDEIRRKLLEELSGAILNCPRLGGLPIWACGGDLEWEEERNYLLMQFDERFVDIYTRDGMMYIMVTKEWSSQEEKMVEKLTNFCLY